jgi:hypothetical protein
VSRLDTIMPAWQFWEFHQTRVAAPPERVFEAIKAVTAGEILFFRTLTWIRRLGRRGSESILNAPKDQPILNVATRSGFFVLADDPPSELVFGTDITSQTFAAINFRVQPADAGAILSTETRVRATSDRARRRFAAYWFVIYPGSALIRRMWLRAVKRRAEAIIGGTPRST